MREEEKSEEKITNLFKELIVEEGYRIKIHFDISSVTYLK